MKAAVFVDPGRIVLDEKPIPEVGWRDAFWSLMVEMALRRRRIYEVQDARSSILARVSLRPDTLAQTVQFGTQTPLADGVGHTFHHVCGRYRYKRRLTDQYKGLVTAAAVSRVR